MITYRINGKSVTKEEWDAVPGAGISSGVPMGTVAYREDRPLISDGPGVFSYQVQETRDEVKRRNIRGVRVRDNGQIEFTSRRGRKEFLKMRGLHDNDGSYGDG